MRIGIHAITSCLLAGLSVSFPVVAQTIPSSSRSGAESALAICEHAEKIDGDVRRRLLRRGLTIAEAAASANPTDPRARLAIFCNLAMQLEDEGVGWRSFGKLRRLRIEIDRALELDPRNADVLAAKGALLLELPGFLGGDARRGELLLRQALSLDRGHETACRYLGRALDARGAPSAKPVEVCSVSEVPQ